MGSPAPTVSTVVRITCLIALANLLVLLGWPRLSLGDQAAAGFGSR
jgi:hypothetical protein